jgi:predicted O-methyltransferase YrrM
MPFAAPSLDDYLSGWNKAQRIASDFNDHYSVMPDQQRTLYDAAMSLRGGIIVELGICHGRTAAMLALSGRYTGTRYFGVDFFGLEGDAETVRAKFEKHRLYGEIIEGNTHAVGQWWDKGPISMLFIDAGHDEANVKPDIEIWLPLLKPGGCVFFHDYDDPYNPASAHWAVRHYADLATEGWEREIRAGMLYARKPLKETEDGQGQR